MSTSYGFSQENKGKVDSALDFPRLKLKKGEKARLAIFGISEDSKLAMATPDGGFFFDLRIPGAEKDFVGSFECIASEADKIEGKFDADVCPHCTAVLGGNISEEVLGPRRRRMVLPVIRYKTMAGSSELVVPNSVEAVAWKFTDRYFNVLVDEHLKWGGTEKAGGLLAHDVTLTCEVEAYQNFTVSIEPNAAYQEDPKGLGQLVIQTYLNQTATLPDGLGRILGSKLNSVDMERKIQETVERAAQLGIGGPVVAIPSVDPATIENLAADLLGSPTPVATSDPVDVAPATSDPVVKEAVSATVDFDAFFASDS